MLSDPNSLKTFLRMPQANTDQDGWLSQVLEATDAIVKGWCKQVLEQAVYTHFPSGMGVQDLVLPQAPIAAPVLSGTLTSGAATVTGLASTAQLCVGMPAIALASGALGSYSSAIPTGATILSVDTATQVTLTANATASGSFSVLFGLAVFLDCSGFYGDGPGGFAPTTQLVLGQDYALLRDAPDGSGMSKSGILKRLGSGITGGALAGGWPWELRRGTLTARLPPTWPQGLGNIKAVYAGGYAPGMIPFDLQLAVNMTAAWVRATTPVGTPITNETVNVYLAALAKGLKDAPPEIGTIRGILRQYRRVSI